MAASIKASSQGLIVVDTARRHRGWTKLDFRWATTANVSTATLKRFWRGTPISKEAFVDICEALELDWQEITELEPGHLYQLLREGVEVWNKWKHDNPPLGYNLDNANLYARDLRGVDLSNTSLVGADLRRAVLENANLSQANLTNANLSEANLRGANLTAAQALSTVFTGADMTGVCLQDWNINQCTRLENVKCNYIYRQYSPDKPLKYGERRPQNGQFAPGDFTALFQKALKTVDLIFARDTFSPQTQESYIYDYYGGYREEVRVEPVKSGETVTDDKLPSPYRGLFPFGPEDAEFFFGRKVFVTELVQATRTRNFISVLGASGSGKSSVVLAGLVPKLQQEGHWKFTYFRPGAIRTKERLSMVDPFYALATALVPLYEPNLNSTAQLAQASELAEYLHDGEVLLGDVITKIQHNYPQHQTLLIADQFEELYTLCQDEALRRRFLDLLLDSIHSPLSPAKPPLVLVATMRVDFLGNALSYPAFADVLRNSDIKIRSMNREELSQVIEKPAQKLGVMFEAGLVNRILDEVEDEPGNLPLLEFALSSLWSKRQGNQLTHKAYEEIGEVKGALTKYAEQKYSELNPNQQSQVRRIFVQLVRPGEGTEDTRRLVTKDELGESRWSLVQQLADERLVVTSRNTASQETVEVVHEALIRNWSQLRQWMAKDRLFRAWQERLRAAMHQWSETKQDEGALLRGASLVEAEEKLQSRQEELSPSEQNFIQQSIALRDRLRQQEEERRQRELETARKIAQESEARRQAEEEVRKQAEEILKLKLRVTKMPAPG